MIFREKFERMNQFIWIRRFRKMGWRIGACREISATLSGDDDDDASLDARQFSSLIVADTWRSVTPPEVFSLTVSDAWRSWRCCCCEIETFFVSSSSFESNPESGRSHSDPRCRWFPGTAQEPETVGWVWVRLFSAASTSLTFFSSIIQSARWWSKVAPLAASSFGSRTRVLECTSTCLSDVQWPVLWNYDVGNFTPQVVKGYVGVYVILILVSFFVKKNSIFLRNL